jgi:dihydroorotase
MNKEAIFLLIRGGHIIDPSQGIDQVGDLLIAEGKIMHIGGSISLIPSLSVILSKAKNLDATGLVVCPGFIDLHCHLREPGFEDKETIATGTKAAAIGGFATVCCMANTEPPLDAPAAVNWLQQKASRDSWVAVLPIGCITKGRQGEELNDMGGLAEAGVVAFSDDGDPVTSSQIMRRAMEYSRDLGLPVIDHCEDKTLSDNGIINEGRVSTKLGLKGIPAAAEEVMVARDLILAKQTRARLHIAHASTKGSTELIRRAKEDGISVTAEVTPYHLTLTEERITGKASNEPFDTNAKVNPPHTLTDKNCGLELAAFGISGFETAFGCLMGLVHQGKISLIQLISKLTCEPAKVIGRNGELGTLDAGALANITILDPDREWVVNSSNFASKGKNTPYDGDKFKGKVMATISRGKLVYTDDSLVIAKSEVTK